VEFKDPIRTYKYVRKNLQKGKYQKRETVFVYLCSCGEEIHLRKSDIKKVSGKCRNCADKTAALLRGQKNRKEPFRALYTTFCYRAKREGKQTVLSFENFLEFTKIKNCHYCNESVFWAEHNLNQNGSSYNLDRKNNKLGYSTDNCVVCCWRCNESKKDNFSYEDWYGMTSYLRNK